MEEATEESRCKHCGLQFSPLPERPEFCCAGCEYVYALIHERGMDRYYDLKEGTPQPAPSSVFQRRNYKWLAQLQTEVESAAADEAVELTLEMQGISCVGCVWLVERVFSNFPGGLSCRVQSTLGLVHLCWQSGECDLVAFARELQQLGYLLGPVSESRKVESDRLVRRVGICAALALNAMLFTLPHYLGMDDGFELAWLFDWLTITFATLSMVVGGSYFFIRSWHSLRRGILHIDLPISLGLIFAFAGSVYAWAIGARSHAYFDFVAIFAFLMLVGRWLQQRAVESNRNQLLRLVVEPEAVTLLLPSTNEGSSRREMPATEVTQGMRYLVEPGAHVPVGSRLLAGDANLGLSWISGESEGKLVHSGGMVPSGAINLGSQAIELEAKEPWTDSLLAELLAVGTRDESRNPVLECVIRYYLVVVLLIAAGGGVAWFLFSGDAMRAMLVTISVLVVSCPCAVGVALPLADELSVSLLRKSGVFIRETEIWPRLGKIRKLLFDKTGTITLESLALKEAAVLRQLKEANRQVLLAMVEDNLHPVSACLCEELLAMGTRRVAGDTALLSTIHEVIGFGMEAETKGHVWRLGRASWALENALGKSSAAVDADAVFSCDGEVVACFEFGEVVRAHAKAQVEALQHAGMGMWILSGDRQEKVSRMGELLGISPQQCLGALTPEEKERQVRQLDQDDTLMLGDGANDSLAFDAAYCTGTPAVERGLLEHKSDFYFLGRSLSGLGQLFVVNQARQIAVRSVLGFAVCYNVITVAICLAGKMNPLAAAILMPISSIVSMLIVAGVMNTSKKSV